MIQRYFKTSEQDTICTTSLASHKILACLFHMTAAVAEDAMATRGPTPPRPKRLLIKIPAIPLSTMYKAHKRSN